MVREEFESQEYPTDNAESEGGHAHYTPLSYKLQSPPVSIRETSRR